LLSSGPAAPWLRIVYNCRDDTRLGSRTLISTDPDVCTKKGGMLLVLITLLATVSYLTGCGGAGSGSSSEGSGQQRATRTADSTEQKAERTDFYEHYKRFYAAIEDRRGLGILLEAKEDMAKSIRSSYLALLKVQSGLALLVATLLTRSSCRLAAFRRNTGTRSGWWSSACPGQCSSCSRL
jgi:Putative exopolysaccharide Exporter (EPS-E)